MDFFFHHIVKYAFENNSLFFKDFFGDGNNNEGELFFLFETFIFQ
jgi:hypothetical protein